MDARARAGLAMAATSGVLYGSVNVLAKAIPEHPFVKAAVAYLASFALLCWFLPGLRIARRDWPKVLAMGLLGAGVAPVLLFYGLQETTAADAGLLLTLELVSTAAFAMVFLRERLRRVELAGIALLFAAALLVSAAASGGGQSTLRGVLFILLAAVAWGVDNTVSARLTGSYRPPQLVALKGLIGTVSTTTAVLVTGTALPTPGNALELAALGLVAIGCSSMLFYVALQRVGAARTSAMNIATTALIAAFGGAALLGETLRWHHAAAVALVLVGAGLMARRVPHPPAVAA